MQLNCTARFVLFQLTWFTNYRNASYYVKPQNQEISGFNKHFYLVNFCQTEPDWDEQSSHFMQNSLQRVWQAKHPACPNIKACPPLSTMMVNLPCLWGSESQLPSFHLFIHRVPAKLSNGVMLHGRNPCRLQLLFVPESSLTYRWHQMALNISADASPALSGGGLYRCGANRSAMGLGLLLRSSVFSR